MNDKKNQKLLRREPQQSRSRARISHILAVTERLLLESGYDALNTNTIAAEAGIAIGSLYHFFPNKLAILEALVTRYYERFYDWLESVHALPQGDQALDVTRYVENLLGGLADFERATAGAVPAFTAMIKVSGKLEELDTTSKEASLKLIGAFYSELGLEGVHAYTVARVVLLVIDGYLLETAEGDEDAYDALRNELKLMLVAYLSAVFGKA